MQGGEVAGEGLDALLDLFDGLLGGFAAAMQIMPEHSLVHAGYPLEPGQAEGGGVLLKERCRVVVELVLDFLEGLAGLGIVLPHLGIC